ncbi:MAG: hypothetical protein R2838_06890 [Caldilineaceae bacterium]
MATGAAGTQTDLPASLLGHYLVWSLRRKHGRLCRGLRGAVGCIRPPDGLLTAGPAVVNLLFTLPAGSWLHHVPIGQAVFRSAFWARILFLPWIFLPLLPLYDLQMRDRRPDPAHEHPGHGAGYRLQCIRGHRAAGGAKQVAGIRSAAGGGPW